MKKKALLGYRPRRHSCPGPVRLRGPKVDSGTGTGSNLAIKVGVFEPMTGANGGGGTMEVEGAKLANKLYFTVNDSRSSSSSSTTSPTRSRPRKRRQAPGRARWRQGRHRLVGLGPVDVGRGHVPGRQGARDRGVRDEPERDGEQRLLLPRLLPSTRSRARCWPSWRSTS